MICLRTPVSRRAVPGLVSLGILGACAPASGEPAAQRTAPDAPEASGTPSVTAPTGATHIEDALAFVCYYAPWGGYEYDT